MHPFIDLLQGRTRPGALVNLAAAAAANAVAIFTLSTLATMVGAKTLVIKRLMIRNNAAGNTFVHVGTGVAGAFVDAILPLYSLNNTTDEYDEWALPRAELLATITAYPDALVGGTIDIQIEVEERG